MAVPRDIVMGMDVSDWQDPADLDYRKLYRDALMRVCFVKVSEGSTWRSKHARTHIERAQRAGMLVGLYHFARPDIVVRNGIGQADILLDAQREAVWFAKQIKAMPRTNLPHVLDLEVPAGAGAIHSTPAHVTHESGEEHVPGPERLRAWTRRFLKTLRAELPRGRRNGKPIIYIGYYFALEHLAVDESLAAHPLWIPWYGVDKPRRVPEPWDDWQLHQYTDSWTGPGSEHGIDANRIRKSWYRRQRFIARLREMGPVGMMLALAIMESLVPTSENAT